MKTKNINPKTKFMKISELVSKVNYAGTALLCAGLLLFSCENSDQDIPSQSAMDNLEVTEAQPATLANDEPNGRTLGDQTYIHFGDKMACQLNPQICENSFVAWPGYLQNTGIGGWGYAWMSSGPRTSFLTPAEGAHYHINGLADPVAEPNPHVSAMFGYDWFAFYMKRDNARVNFDLTKITVLGSVPITLWFKAANGKWYKWSSLKPGRWNLPGATNIQELHIRAASALKDDKYQFDDILVRPL
jgi:hypothetical protein